MKEKLKKKWKRMLAVSLSAAAVFLSSAPAARAEAPGSPEFSRADLFDDGEARTLPADIGEAPDAGEAAAPEDEAGIVPEPEVPETDGREEAGAFADGEMTEEQDPFADGTEALFSEEEEQPPALAGELPEAPFRAASSGTSRNQSWQNYDRWSSPVTSYLTADGSGYLRTEYDPSAKAVLLEYYDAALLRQWEKTIPAELSMFGGFYAGNSAFYLVFGQPNPAESASAEVIRVVKYDKNWNRLGAASLFGANTTVPFDAGSLRMTEYGGYLYIRTSHEMYTSPDGLNHQSNLTLQVRTSDMSVTDSFYEVLNVGYGYVSHSFNQFILADDAGNLVALDHGDAYPRSIVLGRYSRKAGENGFTGGYQSVDVLKIQGSTGDNDTGASIGGLEYSGTHYLTAGSSVPQDAGWASHSARNIFVTATSRSSFSTAGTKLVWLTAYSDGSGLSATTPQLVKLSSDRFLVLWEEKQGYSVTGKLFYAFLDGSGTPMGSVREARGYLSDCRPIVSGGNALWYATDGSKLTFYQVSADGAFHAEPGHLHTYEPEMHFQSAEWKCGLIEGTTVNPLTAKTDGSITYSCDNPAIAAVDAAGRVTVKALGTCTITASASAGVDYRAKSVSYTLKVLPLKKQTIRVNSSLSCVYGDSPSLGASCLGGVKLSYSVDDPRVLTVSSAGKITVKKVGTAIITITAAANEEYAGASASVNVQVSPKDIGRCRLHFTKIGAISSTPADFEDCLIVTDNGRLLKEGVDYDLGTVFWSSSGSSLLSLEQIVYGYGNYTGYLEETIRPIRQKPQMLSVSLGTGGAVITWEKETGAMGYRLYRKQGTGKYKAIATISDRDTVSYTDPEAPKLKQAVRYCIKAYTKDKNGTQYSGSSNVKGFVPVSSLKITLSAGSFTYNGKARTPAVTVKNGTTTLKKNTHYTVTYKNNVNAGTASVTITGKGTYTGTAVKTFTIKKAAQSLSVSCSAKTLARKKTAAITVKGAKGKVTYVSGNKKIATVTSGGRVKGISAGKVTITVKAAGNANYKAASKKITLTVR